MDLPIALAVRPELVVLLPWARQRTLVETKRDFPPNRVVHHRHPSQADWFGITIEQPSTGTSIRADLDDDGRVHSITVAVRWYHGTVQGAHVGMTPAASMVPAWAIDPWRNADAPYGYSRFGGRLCCVYPGNRHPYISPDPAALVFCQIHGEGKVKMPGHRNGDVAVCALCAFDTFHTEFNPTLAP